MSNLTTAVKEYLECVLKGRRYCPRCMGLLPNEHYDDCALGRLVKVYTEVSHAGRS